MAERYRAKSLKQIKRQIAAGEYLPAIHALHAKRVQLLLVLENPECDEEIRIGVFLTCVNSLLGEAYSRAGDDDQAEYWFSHAFKHCDESYDPMVRLRLHRMYAMHKCRVGQYDEALADIDEVIEEMSSAGFELASALPFERIKSEVAFSVSCKAEILLNRQPGLPEGFELAEGVRSTLRSGTKRRYELQNLMLCIPATSRFRTPVHHRRMLMRAWYLNERYAHNGEVRVRLIDCDTVLPLTSMLLKRTRLLFD
jgi:tetratricopeptide (TPR) repeat protein